MKKISILGSTGSIGLSTFEIINKKNFNVVLLSANKNYKLISKQIIKYNPTYFIITDPIIYMNIKKKFKYKKVIILNNFNDLKIVKSDITISAIPGISGLLPTIQFIKFSKKILIANKEAVICGWDLINSKAKKFNTKIIPIDSEHFSILKLLENHKLSEIKKIYITASGGPFLNFNKKKMKNIKPRDALKHPKWKMGKKITIDSASMVNKILEYIEAQKLFKIPKEKLDIIIHPESLVHAILELKNGLVKLLYHETSMIIPLANAMFNGKLNIEHFNLKKKTGIQISNLNFQSPNKSNFPILKIKNRANEYPSTPIIINAANEILVDHFLMKNIPFFAISKVIIKILSDRNYKKYAIKKPTTINQILKINDWAKNLAGRKLVKYNVS
jgi:1-deoxy-D-xylulose-5-phosphate reductoisomerase